MTKYIYVTCADRQELAKLVFYQMEEIPTGTPEQVVVACINHPLRRLRIMRSIILTLALATAIPMLPGTAMATSHDCQQLAQHRAQQRTPRYSQPAI